MEKVNLRQLAFAGLAPDCMAPSLTELSEQGLLLLEAALPCLSGIPAMKNLSQQLQMVHNCMDRIRL